MTHVVYSSDDKSVMTKIEYVSVDASAEDKLTLGLGNGKSFEVDTTADHLELKADGETFDLIGVVSSAPLGHITEALDDAEGDDKEYWPCIKRYWANKWKALGGNGAAAKRAHMSQCHTGK
mgnify:FL=1